MKKMNVITFKKTGHVLAAVTRATQPETEATVAQVAAGGIRMRKANGDKGAMIIPDRELRVELVDFKTEVLHRPQLFALEDGQPEQKTGTTGLAVALNGTQITVTLPVAVNTLTNVWCQISGGALTEPIVRSVTIPGTATVPLTTATETLTLSNGAYLVALFAPGYVVAVIEESV